MSPERTTFLASVIVAVTGILWGFYWYPLRSIEAALPGAWGSLAVVVVAVAVLLPFAVTGWRQFTQASPSLMAAIALGGVAFFLYSISLAYGRVAVIILLFFLTPVWSVLIGRLFKGWPISGQRLVAVLLGLLGLGIMLGAEGEWPVPRGIGEWLALISGVVWSISTTAMKGRAPMPPPQAGVLFALGGLATALIVIPLLSPWPAGQPITLPWPGWGWALAAGTFWFALSIPALMWATQRLDPARVGILMMTEVLVGAVSAAVLAGEHLNALEIVGGALVVLAGLIEVWPAKPKAARSST